MATPVFNWVYKKYNLRTFRIIYKELEELIKEVRAEEEARAKEVERSVLEPKEFGSGKSAVNRRVRIGRNNILNILKDLILEIK